MSGRNERGSAVAIGMSARLLTPDSPVPDLLDEYGGGEGDGIVE